MFGIRPLCKWAHLLLCYLTWTVLFCKLNLNNIKPRQAIHLAVISCLLN